MYDKKILIFSIQFSIHPEFTGFFINHGYNKGGLSNRLQIGFDKYNHKFTWVYLNPIKENKHLFQ